MGENIILNAPNLILNYLKLSFQTRRTLMPSVESKVFLSSFRNANLFIQTK